MILCPQYTHMYIYKIVETGILNSSKELVIYSVVLYQQMWNTTCRTAEWRSCSLLVACWAPFRLYNVSEAFADFTNECSSALMLWHWLIFIHFYISHRKAASPADFNGLTILSDMKTKLKYFTLITWCSFTAHSRYRNPIHSTLGDPKEGFKGGLKTKE